jgi:hypothetical protein
LINIVFIIIFIYNYNFGNSKTNNRTEGFGIVGLI